MRKYEGYNLKVLEDFYGGPRQISQNIPIFAISRAKVTYERVAPRSYTQVDYKNTNHCYSACPCVHVSSLHIHLDIAHNSSSYSLIIIIRSLSRSAGSFPSNKEEKIAFSGLQPLKSCIYRTLGEPP